MPQILFTFTFDTETKTGAIAGNCDSLTALQTLQLLVYADIEKRVKNKPEEMEK